MSNRIPIDEESFLRDHPELMQRVAADMLRGEHAARMVEMLEMQKLAQAAAHVEHIASEVCTEDFIQTGRGSYWEWVAREGHEIWSDPAFRRAYLRDNPWARRKVVTGRTVITANTPWETKAVKAASLITA